MLINRTPFRISFFGGGTDFPSWYQSNGGAVLSTTIDKYCYISCRRLPPFFQYKYRIVYSKQETVNELEEIIHPAVRETLKFMGIDEGVEIHHDGDLPARAGLGSSSAFTVGLLQALYALRGKMVTKKRLSLDAIHIEQEMIKEHVGSQDQVAVAFGGFNKITFSAQHNFEVTPIILNKTKNQQFQDHLMMFFTGFSRIASEIEKEKLEKISGKRSELLLLHDIVGEAINILTGDGDMGDFGKLLNESWNLKKRLSDKVSTIAIDSIYESGIKNGAIGGKLLGAGGGGFMLFFVKPEDKDRLRHALRHLLHVPFRFETQGSQIIYYSESGV